MSGTFSGFSEEDIKKAQNGLPVSKPVVTDTKIKMGTKSKRTTRPMVRFDESRNRTANISDINEIPEQAKLHKEIVELEIVAEAITNTEESTESKEINPNDSVEVNNDASKSSNSIPEKKPLNIDEMQARQKVMEEQNRRRKELLVRALADKRKRTQEETHRLNEIQGEFKKLDALLSNDVKFLRKRIEIASIDYMEAQKRYLKIEREFLDAKLALQQKLEKKELLTEHLCTIIEQNEERKAEKLTELLNKLELKDVDEVENSKEATIE